MAENVPISAIASATKAIANTNKELAKTESSLKSILSLTRSMAGAFKSGFATASAFGSMGQVNSLNLGSSNANFGGGGTTGGGNSMPWIYTKAGAVTYGAAQTAVGTAAAAYAMMPDLGTALATRSAYYQGAILSPGMSAANLAQRTLGALGPAGVTSPTDAAAAQAILTQGFNFNPSGASYLRAMQEVGGAARMMGISNPQAAMAMGALHTGDMSSRLYQAGISTIDTKTGTIRSTEDIYKQIYNRYFGGKGPISQQDIEISLREGFAGKELRSVLGFTDDQMRMFKKAAIEFSQGKGFNLADATGKGNPSLDIYKQQTSLAVTTETKADELLAGLTTATNLYVKMNEQLQGDGGVVNGLARLKGVLQGIFGTNAGNVVTTIASTVGSVATTALAYKGLKAAGLLGRVATKGASTVAGGAAAETAGKVLLVDKLGAPLLTSGTTAAAAKAVSKAGMAGVASKVVLGRAIPVLGGAVSEATGQGFLSTVATSALAAGVIGGISTGGLFAAPAALAGGTLAAVGWLGAKAFHSMFATSKTQQPSGDMNQEQWATALLQRMGAPVTNENLTAIMTWMKREGGNWGNSAKYNPLNTTLGAPGAKAINKVGVKAFTSWDQGLQATTDTLQKGGQGYENIWAALKQGNSATAVLQAIQQSNWAGKSHYGGTLATSALTTPSGSASTSLTGNGHTVNITLKIDKASDAEAIAFAKKVKEILMKDKSVYNTGSK